MSGWKIPAFAALIVFGVTPVHCQERNGPDYRVLDERLSPVIAEAMKKAGAAGLSVALVDQRGMAWAKGFGYADKAREIPAKPETLYRAAALSPQLTATEILRRTELGELHLDDTLATHLPGFSIRSRFTPAKPITIRALLANHAGLPSQLAKGGLALHMTSAQAAAGLAALPEQLRSEYLAEPPQTLYKPSLIGFSLLGRVIEVKSGRSFAEAMDAGLLQPLGMTRSTYAPASAGAAGEMAKPYRAGAGLGDVEARDRPAVSLISSVADAAQFVRFILNDGKILEDGKFLNDSRTASGQVLIKPETLKTMFEPQFAGSPLDFGERGGFGWRLNSVKIDGAGPTARASAAFTGYSGAVLLSREQRLGAIVFSNDDAAVEATLQIARKTLETALAVKLRRPAPAEPEAAPKPSPYKGANVEEFAGDYVVTGRLVHVVAEDGKLVGEASGHRVELIPVAKDRFMPQFPLLGSIDLFGLFKYSLPALSVRPVSAAGRRFALLEGFPQIMAFERIKPAPIPPAWRTRLGQYRCDNPDEAVTPREVTLTETNGVLTLTTHLFSKPLDMNDFEQKIAFLPISDGEAVAAGIGFDEGGTMRAVERDGKMTLAYSGFNLTRRKE